MTATASAAPDVVPPDPEVVLEVSHLTLRFKGLVALNDVSLTIPRGKITGIIGPNGAGKSSLLNCISGFYHGT
jgi:branched-chain amino acid transport system ATP-binding protein